MSWEEGFASGKTFAIQNRFWDNKLITPTNSNGWNIKGSHTWGKKFNSTPVRGSDWNAGFCEGVRAGLSK